MSSQITESELTYIKREANLEERLASLVKEVNEVKKAMKIASLRGRQVIVSSLASKEEASLRRRQVIEAGLASKEEASHQRRQDDIQFFLKRRDAQLTRGKLPLVARIAVAKEEALSLKTWKLEHKK